MRLVRNRDPQLHAKPTRPATTAEANLLFETQLLKAYSRYVRARDATHQDKELEAECAAELLEVVRSIIRRDGFSTTAIGGIASRQRKQFGDFDNALVIVD